MRRVLLAAVALFTLTAGVAHAASMTVGDPTGDFLASYAGSHDPDLDVTSFTVDYDASGLDFLLSATLAGDIDPTKAGLYVIGVDTGAGAIRPFASIGAPNVIFDQVIVLLKTGLGGVSGHPLTAAINGDQFTVMVPTSFLPSTGADFAHYGFNLWPRTGLGDNTQIADFAPDNANLASVPEPASWALLLMGFGAAGGLLRAMRRRQRPGDLLA